MFDMDIDIVTSPTEDAIPEEDRIDYEDEEDEDSSAPPVPPTSADPTQPLSSAPAMDAALADIAIDAPGSRTRRNERRPAGVDLHAMLREKVEAGRQVAAATKAEADGAAASGRAARPRLNKRSRPLSGSSPTAPGKKAKGANPATDPNAMDTTGAKPAKSRPTSFEHLFKPGRLPCAVRIDRCPIMGNPFSQTPGWDVKVDLDPGRLAQPSVGLDFKFSKDGTDSRLKDHYNTFAVGWEPGVRVGDQWMMEGFEVEAATKPSNAKMLSFTYPAAIRELCKDQKQADRLYCATFQSNVHKTTPMTEEWAKSLPGNDWVAPYRNLQRMFSAEDPSYQVTVWFLSPYAGFDRFHDCCLKPLADAVRDHTPPFHQYLDENDEPMVDFGLKTIEVIGNGMYRRYPKITNKEGKKVENRVATPTFLTLPKTATWDSIKTFHITYGVPIVREVQYNEGIHVQLEKDWHRIFLQRMPVIRHDGKDLRPDPAMKDSFWAGVRMTRDPATGLKAAIPKEGDTVVFDFFNGDAKGKEHEKDKTSVCYGRVDNFGGRLWLDKTGTDFCCLMTMPRRSRLKLMTCPEAAKMEDNCLPLAKLMVKINREPAIRDQRAFKKFCDPQFAPELLDPIRLAFWSDPSKAGTITDLTKGPAHNRSNANKKRYKAVIEEMKAARKSNKSQDAVLMAASAMRSNLTAVQGPPGAGKTRTLRDKMIALAKVGHKVLCVASSNVAVDTDATAVYKALGPEDRKIYKCLRLETDGAERAQRLSKLDFAEYTGEEGEEDKMPEYRGPREAQDNPAIRICLDKICVEFAARQEYATKMLDQYEDVNQAYKAIQNYDSMKRSNVAAGMTLDYRIWEMSEVDNLDAEAEYKLARAKMTTEAFDKQFASGEISVAKFNKSQKYKDCIANYISKGGKVTKAERTALEDESDAMIERVFKDTTFLFSTASNCGGALLEDSRSYVPTVIVCDEAGQISIPSLCVPLTTFDKWEGLFLFGDIQQLEPTALSGRYNEFIANARMSPLALLAMKKFDSKLLDEQYRMCPACSAFPRTQFYDDKGLKDSEAVKEDNSVRKAVREMTKALRVDGDRGEGTEYVVTNVPNGCSRVELNGTSLVNHANADVVIKMIDRFIKGAVIKASGIKVLSYYQGQRRLIRKKIDEMPWPQAIKEAIEVSTVDAFQGREASVVIVDTVAAKDKLNPPSPTEDNAPEDEEDLGGEYFVKSGTITGHVRSPNRLNVALTRGKDATIILCQTSLLVSAARPNRGKQYNAIANMVGNAEERKCLMADLTEDSHPGAVKYREGVEARKLSKERDLQRQLDLGFIAEGRRAWEKMKGSPAIPMAPELRRYRTKRGHTTRPIGNPKLVAEADAVDEEQRQVELAKATSLATGATEAEDQRRLQLGIVVSQDSAGFPALPATKAVTTAQQHIAMDTGLQGNLSDEEEEDFGFYDFPNQEPVEGPKVGKEYEMLDPGTEDDQFA